jgi:hypothetical protein
MEKSLSPFRLWLHAQWSEIVFYIFPSQRTLLHALWDDYAYYRRLRSEANIYEYLDSLVWDYKEELDRPGRISILRQKKYLLQGLMHKRVREEIVLFFESDSPEKKSQAVVEKIRSLWRLDNEASPVPSGTITIVGAWDPAREKEAPMIEQTNCSVVETATLFNAKAYFIAAELYFELKGEEREFGPLSVDLTALKSFIKKQFGVEKLPGTFDNLKGTSYKIKLADKSTARRGQLKPPLRQIAEHPEVFGADVAERARYILEKLLK